MVHLCFVLCNRSKPESSDPGLDFEDIDARWQRLLGIGSSNRVELPVQQITCRYAHRNAVTPSCLLQYMWSGSRDSNPGPPAPKAGALPSCAAIRLMPQYTGRRYERGALATVLYPDSPLDSYTMILHFKC